MPCRPTYDQRIPEAIVASGAPDLFPELKIQQHNEIMPHSAFNGLTPGEVHFGKTDDVVESRAADRVSAGGERIEVHRATSCPTCPRAPPASEAEGTAAWCPLSDKRSRAKIRVLKWTVLRGAQLHSL
jgi:hypothetical protein